MGDATQGPLSGVVGETDETVAQEAEELGPTSLRVGDRIGGVVAAGGSQPSRLRARRGLARSANGGRPGGLQGTRR